MIVLIILGVLLLLIGGCAVSCFVLGKKAQSALSKYESHPELAGIAMAASMHPDIKVLSEDSAAGTITLKNTKTGEVLHLNIAQIKSGEYEQSLQQLFEGQKVSAPAESPAEPVEAPAPKPEEPKVSAAKAATMEAALAKFPAFLPAYSRAQTLTARVATSNGRLGGQYEAVSKDSPAVVAEFYAQAIRAAGLEIAEQSEDSNDYGPVIMISSYFEGGAVNVRIESQEGDQSYITADFAGVSK
ncbi:MAG: hypothetical protein BWX86_02397 [Verrucomicrobia bacterium ADurb.Bin122]|jgi:hypothetical protein|nr:MAG: hypothetical protein BWX86_02397 [Verrucomicrobia bacterium ADurb.Bin122]